MHFWEETESERFWKAKKDEKPNLLSLSRREKIPLEPAGVTSNRNKAITLKTIRNRGSLALQVPWDRATTPISRTKGGVMEVVVHQHLQAYRFPSPEPKLYGKVSQLQPVMFPLFKPTYA